jgi:mannose-1-phosphate guanylyltransferase
MITPVILSGGSGTRLWPLSRKDYPKQFINLINDSSLFQDTINRLPKNTKDPLIICNEEHRFLVAEQLRNINKKTAGIILEPIGKNTAPAVALAALSFVNKSEDPILLVLSSDHLIKDNISFHKSIEIAEKLAHKGKLVTFGVKPIYPETGYGYIEAIESKKSEYYKIKSFKEKPLKNIAIEYLQQDNFYWNSGIFMFKASTFLKELKKFSPNILSACKKSFKSDEKDLDFIRLVNEEFYKCPSDSIDYALMENTKDGVVVPLDAGWNDVGSWSALYDVKQRDINNNLVDGDVYLDGVQNSYIHSTNRLISVIGLSDIVLIDTQDALLVADKKYDQKISTIIDRLKRDNRRELVNHRKVYRPWGYFDSIDSGIDFQVKRILINPNAKLSLQKHHFRSEHWIVISGSAIITCGEEIFQLKKNQSTYIPLGKVHRLENPNNTPLEIIEVQTGSYLGEDDVIRLEDDFGRN